MFLYRKLKDKMYAKQGAPAPGYQSGQPYMFTGYQDPYTMNTQGQPPMGIPPPPFPLPPQNQPRSNPASTEIQQAQQELETIWEIPVAMKDQHEVEFYNRSANFEDSLMNLQLILVIDHSGSMLMPDEDGTGQGRDKGMTGKPYWSRFDNLFQIAKYLAESLIEYDKDKNIPVYLFGNDVVRHDVKSMGEMLLKFKKVIPIDQQGTNLLGALEKAFNDQVNDLENMMFIVITDGTPNDGQVPRIKNLIQERIAKKDPTGKRLNMLFIRIGDDRNAIAFLKDLDDCKEVGDNVDTKSDNMVYKMGPKNLILNAIHEHLDKDYQD